MPEELEQQQPAAVVPTPEPAGEPAPVLSPNFVRAYGTGRRKEAVARVYLLPSSGSAKFTVNGRAVEEFFPRQTLRFVVFQPLEATATKPLFDVKVTVRGGGPMGQAGAVRLGVARALLEYNIELRKKLKKLGFLTRDARVHERKKYGQKGARKRFQFSKR